MRLAENDAKKLGAAIRQRRESINMSRAALGRLVGRDPASIQTYEQGGKKAYGNWIVGSPSDAVLEAIADELGTSPEELFVAAGLVAPAAEEAGAEALAHNANGVRAVNARLSGVTITGKADDVAALLALALERGLMGRLKFQPVHTP